MNKSNLIWFFVLAFILPSIIIAGCSTTPVSPNNNSMAIQSLTISPEVVAPNSFVLLSVNAFDSDGDKMFFRLGTGETLALDQNKQIVIQAPDRVGTSEINFVITNGRKDVYYRVPITVDSNQPASTIRTGRATLPLGKSFDFFSGSVVDQYYGDMDYRTNFNKILDFSGNRDGSTISTFDGGLVNFTSINADVTDLPQVVKGYSGTYWSNGSVAADSDVCKLQVGSVYCFLLRYSNDFLGKFKIISIDDEKIVFDWIFQKSPNETRFYDFAPLASAVAAPAAPKGLAATASAVAAAVALSWEAVNEADMAGYYIYRSTTSGSGFSKIGSVGLVTTYTNEGLRANTTYYYKLKAVDSAFNISDFSAEISVTTLSSEAGIIFSDDGERGMGNWDTSGFTLSSTRSASASHGFYSGKGNDLSNTLTLKTSILLSGKEYLQFKYFYELENGFDYLYAQVSEDKTNWETIDSFTGASGSWKATAKYMLSRYAGKSVYIRFLCRTDGSNYYEGAYVDDITIARD